MTIARLSNTSPLRDAHGVVVKRLESGAADYFVEVVNRGPDPSNPDGEERFQYIPELQLDRGLLDFRKKALPLHVTFAVIHYKALSSFFVQIPCSLGCNRRSHHEKESTRVFSSPIRYRRTCCLELTL